MSSNLVTGLLVVGMLALGGYVLTQSDSSGSQGEQGPVGAQGPAGQDGRNGVDGKNGVNGKSGADGGPSFGAASGPSLTNGCLDMGGGSFLCTYRQAFGPASTTCAFRPGLASSTLIRATARVTNARGSTFDLEFGKSPNINATTTSLGRNASVSTGVTVTASSSPANFSSNAQETFHFNAGDMLNVKVGSSTFSGVGVCTAMFMSI